MKKKVFDGKLLKVFQSDITMPNGHKVKYEHIDHPGAALVIPVVNGKIVLIRQYRPILGKYIWELPAGTLEKGESPMACAKREVEEETGYIASSIKQIGKIYTTPGFCDEIIYIFKAICREKGSHNRDKDELISSRLFTKQEVNRLFKNGRINDSKTISALAFSSILTRSRS